MSDIGRVIKSNTSICLIDKIFLTLGMTDCAIKNYILG